MNGKCLAIELADVIVCVVQDIREYLLVSLDVTNCKYSRIQLIRSWRDYLEDLKYFFFLYDFLERKMLDEESFKQDFISEHAFYILHSSIFYIIKSCLKFSYHFSLQQIAKKVVTFQILKIVSPTPNKFNVTVLAVCHSQ